MKYSIYRAIDKTDGHDSLFLVDELTKRAVSVYFFDDYQIEFLEETAKDKTTHWFSHSMHMGNPVLVKEFEA